MAARPRWRGTENEAKNWQDLMNEYEASPDAAKLNEAENVGCTVILDEGEECDVAASRSHGCCNLWPDDQGEGDLNLLGTVEPEGLNNLGNVVWLKERGGMYMPKMWVKGGF